MLKRVSSWVFGVMSWLVLTAAWAEASVPDSISVRGHAVVEVAADRAYLSLGVMNQANQAQTALAENNRQMQQLYQALVAAGVQEDELSTRAVQVQPQWQPRPRNADAQWQPKIMSYQARGQLQLETAQMEKVADFIQAAVEAGANQLGQLRFGLNDRTQAQQQALTQATEHAQQQASVVAKAAGVELEKLHRVTVDPVDGARIERFQSAPMARMAMDSHVPVILPDLIEVSAGVELIYRIQSSPLNSN